MQGIDFVVPMLFPDDPVWQKEYMSFFGGPMPDMDVTPRWRSWGTEELVIKGVLKFMPWVRRIHIILFGESQIKPWMQQYGDKIHIVLHQDYIPSEYLPCFNSCTIETFLGDIPGLSAQFIYGNDDMYPVAPMEPEDFFRNSKPCQSYKEVPYVEDTYINNVYKRKCFNELNIIAKDFGRTFTDTYLTGNHSLSAMLRKTCRNIWREHGNELTSHIFQLRTDRSINQYIYAYYQHLSGRYVDHTPKYRLVSMWDKMIGILSAVHDPALQVVCVNDNNAANVVWKQAGEKLYTALEERINNTKGYYGEEE